MIRHKEQKGKEHSNMFFLVFCLTFLTYCIYTRQFCRPYIKLFILSTLKYFLQCIPYLTWLDISQKLKVIT